MILIEKQNKLFWETQLGFMDFVNQLSGKWE